MLPSSAELARLATANFARHAGWVHERSPGMTARTGGGLYLADSGTGCDTFNIVLGARLASAGAPAAVREAIAQFGDRQFSWWVAPGDEPANLGALLTAAGLAPSESELAMALSLDGLAAGPARPGGLKILRATTTAGLADFARINAANWSPPDAHVIEFYGRAQPLLLSPGSPFRFFVGYDESGTAVAASEATLDGDVVGLYNICTLASHRRRGYGGALTLAPLLDAREAGCRIAVLQAAPEGVSVYRRLGFREFGTITEYKPA